MHPRKIRILQNEQKVKTQTKAKNPKTVQIILVSERDCEGLGAPGGSGDTELDECKRNRSFG
jgi:hypothetical protein